MASDVTRPKQNDMMLRIGVSRQQYQRLESKDNPRLETLELIAKGLNSEIMLIPKDKLGAVLTVLEERSAESQRAGSDNSSSDSTGRSKPKSEKFI